MNKIIKLLLIVLPLLFSITCIERNNPWDPINGCPEEVKAEFRRDPNQVFQIETLRNNVLILSTNVGYFLNTFYTDEANAEKIYRRNDSLKSLEPAIRSFNDSIIGYNFKLATVDCKALALKDSFAMFDTVTLLFLDSTDNLMERFKSDSIDLVRAIASGNDNCQPLGIYTRKQMDSILAPVFVLSKSRDSLKNLKAKYSSEYSEQNNAIRDHNRDLLMQNQGIFKYNDSIQTEKYYCQKNPVLRSDTLKELIKNILPGDTLFLGARTFTGAQLDITGKGDSSIAGKQIVIMGSPFMNTILDSMKLFITNCNNIKFENIIIQNGFTTSGVKIQENSKNIVFTNCVIKNNSLYGIESAGSSFKLENCELTNNREGGVKIDKGQNSSDVLFEGRDVIIANNGKQGIYSIRATIYLHYATISDNDSNGVYFNTPQTSSNFDHTIFSFNGLSGVFHDRSENVNGTVNFNKCNFYNNTIKNIDIKEPFVDINSDAHFEDPVFIDKNQNNYRISTSSMLHGLDIGYRYED